MYTVYTADTPNGRKVTIALEELGLPYELHHVDLSAGEQHTPEFLALSPNGKIPVVVRQRDGHAIFESGAVLIELADQGGFLLPSHGAARDRVLSWLFLQVGSVGPMLGQVWWFRHGAAAANPDALARYDREARRLYGVVDRELARSAFLGSDTLSIADIAMYPWLATYEELGIGVAEWPHVVRWLAWMAERPAVVRGLARARPGSVAR
ncbi:glutathione S-transferase [Massilia arenosa]|uniref:Glutathione S-transferase n=1 Tax=Zemynaea arenosa TaxID=2561931 RepID=A0A4Y9SBF2_9BURK|nr:glutathione S-transferase N-terminal domain-containing protein [Massilia arenosa]TFW19486.1 glutathione S-transferase [Massilia arenosa]